MATTRRSFLTAATALAATARAARPVHARRLRLAIVQMQSNNHDVDGNLARAEELATQAAARGARLILFPELMPTGYSLSYDIWDSAEPSSGKTSRWLARTSHKLGVYLGTSFLEAAGEDFFNTFVLTDPLGRESGRVRKQVPADAEAYFFTGAAGPHVIDSALGRIGVGICAENYYCFLANLMAQHKVDLVLMPHSAPDSSPSGGLPAAPGTHLALWYARKLGVPVAFVNKVGPFVTKSLFPPPAETRGFFPGLSCIVDGSGTVLANMDNREGIATADVHLDPRRKNAATKVCDGIGIAELTIGGPAGAGSVARTQALGAESYAANPERKRKAREMSRAG